MACGLGASRPSSEKNARGSLSALWISGFAQRGEGTYVNSPYSGLKPSIFPGVFDLFPVLLEVELRAVVGVVALLADAFHGCFVLHVQLVELAPLDQFVGEPFGVLLPLLFFFDVATPGAVAVFALLAHQVRG